MPDYPEYPLPNDVLRGLESRTTDAAPRVAPGVLDHAGLALYRFIPRDLKDDARRQFLEAVRDRFNAHQGERPWRAACESASARLAAAAASFRSRGRPVASFEAVTASRLLVGTGYKSALEIGLTFHHPGGFPYLPGTSVKGLCRAWAEDVEEAPPELVRDVFGTASKDEHEEAYAMAAGAVCFLDALPVHFPRLDLDLLNPHYGAYYRDDAGATPPGDWLEPVPVSFLAVAPNQRFRFLLVGRSASDAAAVDTARGWLEQALVELGAGAKTSAGYGYFTVAAASDGASLGTTAATDSTSARKQASVGDNVAGASVAGTRTKRSRPQPTPRASAPSPGVPEQRAEVGRNSTGIPARVVGHQGRRMLVVRLHVEGYEQKDFPLGGVNGADFDVGDWITVNVANMTKRKRVAQVSFDGRLDV